MSGSKVQALRAQQAQAVAKLKLAVEQRAVLAEQHPDCFTPRSGSMLKLIGERFWRRGASLLRFPSRRR